MRYFVNTTFIAMGLAILMGAGFLIGLGALSLLTGAFHFLFVRPKFLFLKSQHGLDGFAFGFSKGQTAEDVRFDTIKLHLFNPFGEPTQLEITRSFEPSSDDFAVDLNLGAPLKQFVAAKGFKAATIEIEVSARKGGITHILSMSGEKFLNKFLLATESTSQFLEKHKSTETKTIYPEIPERSFVAAPMAKKGMALKLATNPEFAGDFAGAGAGVEGKAAGAANFTVAKVWIEPGCIVCDACAGIFPEVFEVTSTSCIIKPGAPLNDGLKIQESAEACPVEVIKFTKA